MKLLIVRHGETEWTITGQHTGTTEIPLTEQGRKQTRELGAAIDALLEDDRKPLVFTSPRTRAIETVELAMPGSPYQIEELLCEIDYGDFEGLSPDEILALDQTWRIWNDPCPNGEGVNQAGDRADRLLAKVRTMSRPVVTFTHGHMSRILAARALDLPPSSGEIFASSTASISVIAAHRGRNVIKLWNYTGLLGSS